MKIRYHVLFLALIALLAGSCSMKKKISILALGDSYTIGESVTKSERWPVQLAAQLNSLDFNVQPPDIIAVTGWTTDELLTGIDTSSILKKRYDLVTVLIGVNNQYRGRDIANYEQELKLILERAVRLAGNQKEKVLVLSIPDWGVTPFAAGQDTIKISNEIDSYNSSKKAMADSLSLKYIDITGISRMVNSKPSYIAEDGLHPSGEMYSKWVEQILPSILSILNNTK